MTQLSDLQQLFWRSVRVDPAPSAADSTFVSRGSLNAQRRMGIYRTAYWVRQVSALRELFPTVVSHLGDGPFAREASRYLQEFPARSWALEDIGEEFPAWLAVHAEPWLAEVAAIEWARWTVFVAVDSHRVSVHDVYPEKLSSTWVQVGPHVAAVQAGLKALTMTCPQLQVPQGQTHLAIWRSDFAVFNVCIERNEAAALCAAQAGISFPELCEAFNASEHEVEPLHIFNAFSRWLQRGWVIRLSEGNRS